MGYGSFTVLYFMLLVAYLLMMRVHYVMKISSILIVSLECPIAQFTDTHEIHYSTLALFGSLFCYTLVVQVSDVCLMVYIYIMPIILIMLYIILVKCFYQFAHVFLTQHQNTWGPFLIVSPASTLHNWQQECTRFLPVFKVSGVVLPVVM